MIGQTELTHFLIMTFSKKEIYTGEEVEIKCSWNSEHQEMNVKLKCGNETKTENGSALLKLTMTKEWNKKLCKCEGMHLGKHIVTSQLIHVYCKYPKLSKFSKIIWLYSTIQSTTFFLLQWTVFQICFCWIVQPSKLFLLNCTFFCSRKNFKLLSGTGIFWLFWSRTRIFDQWENFMPFCLGHFLGQQ